LNRIQENDKRKPTSLLLSLRAIKGLTLDAINKLKNVKAEKKKALAE
jgi:hypothetical protein